MKDDNDKLLIERTRHAIARIDTLMESMNRTLINVKRMSQESMRMFSDQADVRQPGDPATLKMRFKLEDVIDSLQFSISTTRKKYVEHHLDLQQTLSEGITNLAEITKEDRDDPRIPIRMEQIELLEMLAKKSEAILSKCDYAQEIVAEVDKVIVVLN